MTKLPYTIERPPQTPYIEEEEREIAISFSQPLQLEPPNSPIVELPIVQEPQIENAAVTKTFTNVEQLPLEKNILLVSPDFMAHF